MTTTHINPNGIVVLDHGLAGNTHVGLLGATEVPQGAGAHAPSAAIAAMGCGVCRVLGLGFRGGYVFVGVAEGVLPDLTVCLQGQLFVALAPISKLLQSWVGPWDI